MHNMKSDPYYLFHFFSKLYKMVFLMEVDELGYRYVEVTEEAQKLSSLPDDWKNKYIQDMYEPWVTNPLISQYDLAASTGEPVFFSDKMNKPSNVSEFAASVLLPLEDQHKQVRYILCLTNDLTDETASKLLSAIENIDSLTGLPNLIKVKSTLAEMQERDPALQVAILYLNIDRFKFINELLGIEETNMLFKKLARAVSSILPMGSIMGRIDGDEFIISLVGESANKAMEVATGVLDEISTFSYLVNGIPISVTGCIGVSHHADELQALIASACTAMVDAKRKGRNNISVYTPNGQLQNHVDEVMIETELARALQNNELNVFYQPKLNPVSGKINFEALVRWYSPKLGVVPPLKFVQLAEKSSLILELTKAVTKKVCQDFEMYPEIFSNTRTAINLSAVIFEPEMIDEAVLDILKQYSISPEVIEIEITESMLMTDPAGGMETIHYLQESGFTVVIDDFGVSYSSLNYLKMFALDGIKIDRSFIKQITETEGKKDIDIVHFIIQLAKKLNMKVTAEGVETKQQFDLLTGLGCNEIQGYFLSKPVPAEQLEDMLNTVHKSISLKRTPDEWVASLQAAVTIDTAEKERLHALYDLNILDTPSEETFERITRTVRDAFHVPITFISFIDDERQWFKSCIGLPEPVMAAREVPRDQTICDKVIRSGEPLIIDDMFYSEDPSIQILAKEAGLHFYAGIPIKQDGQVIGTFCIADFHPRRLSDEQIARLHDYTAWIDTELKLRIKTVAN
ncbi:EAL domain-containing protein [Jeotgalibacillus sp. R-1-5s-1]|uniref:EAL domain-containing protein n=1 Tax=Jeotgalibacillus sp. R-1-5s-1 TaxID=2555897 RepID=UPI00141BCE77|nr:EAL domain-containing protein [Jeotgalibacillus sp. R-1-5s-1]